MSDAGEIEIFQRWPQSKLVATQHIEDPIERDRRRSHIESAISEAIYFRESLEKLESLESPSPFIGEELLSEVNGYQGPCCLYQGWQEMRQMLL